MDTSWLNSRLHYPRFAALALALTFPLFGQAETPIYKHQTSAGFFTAARGVRVTNQTGFNLNVRCTTLSQNVNIANGASYTFGGSVQVEYTGLVSGATLSLDGTVPDYAIAWNRVGFPSTDAGSVNSAGFDFEATATFGAPPYIVHHVFTNATFTIGSGGVLSNYTDVAGDSQGPPDPDEGKIFGSGILMLDNQTGQPQEMQFGDEVLTLAPGMNAIPFRGQVDENGMPLALPPAFSGSLATAPDGTKYIHGALTAPAAVPGFSNLPPTWAPAVPVGVNGLEVFGPVNNQSGPTVRAPGANGSPVYNQLPPGMSAGSTLPLPGGMSVGTPGLPPGITPGTNGALPNGVASGGVPRLPFGVSPGTRANPYPSGVTPLPSSGIRPPGTRTTDPGVIAGGSSGGSGSSGGVSSSAPSGGSGGSSTTSQGGIASGGVVQTQAPNDASTGYQAGSTFAGLDAEAMAKGQTAAQEGINATSGALSKITGAVGDGLGDASAFWTLPDEGFFSASDSSWRNMTLALGVKSVSIEIPEEWLTVLRSILLWVIRIYFVIGCIRLVMH